MDIHRHAHLGVCFSAVLAACGGTVTGIPDGGSGSDSGSGGADSGHDSGTGTDGNPGQDAPSTGCPTSPPASSGACSDPGLKCEYGSNPNLGCNDLDVCTSSGWMNETPGETCPPQSDCPGKYLGSMAQNQPCPMSDIDLTCSYPQGTCICTDGSLPVAGGPNWTCFPATSACPSPRPRLGTACDDPGTQCDYGSCEGGIAMDCENGVWTEVFTPCPAAAGGSP